MTPRQCEIAAESYTASLLAQCGYDVLVQYGANQPHYDLIAVKNNYFLPISVKGTQLSGWILAVKFVKPGVNYHQAIDQWLSVQRNDIIFVLVQFMKIEIGQSPRVYIARAKEIADHMKTQCNGRGHGSLQEDFKRDYPRSQYNHKIPSVWKFSEKRLEEVSSLTSINLV
jgi:hypothetical protein